MQARAVPFKDTFAVHFIDGHFSRRVAVSSKSFKSRGKLFERNISRVCQSGKTHKKRERRGSLLFLDIYMKADIAELPSFLHSLNGIGCFSKRVHMVDNGADAAAFYQFQHLREFLIASH